MGIFLLVIVIIVVASIISKSIKENNVKSNSSMQEDAEFIKSERFVSGKIFSNKTREVIEKEAEEKYKRISDNKKQQHLHDRKIFIKLLYISLSCFFIVVGLSCVLVAIRAEGTDIFPIMLGVGLFTTGIVLVIVLIAKLKQSNESLILKQLRKVLRKTYNSLTTQKVAKYKSYVKQNSPMYKNIKSLNAEYKFDRTICKTHHYHEYLNSKRQLDNFNYEKWIIQKMTEESEFFDSFEQIYEDNAKNYKEYTNKYNELKKFRKEIEIEDLELDFESFNYIEREIFNESKHETITKPNISLEISYTSPSGRNHYSANHTYTYSDLLSMVREKEEQEKQLQAEKEKKEKLAAEKRAKEKKLRELDKLEKKLAEKEQEINKKEKEFLEATKEHIYTTDNVAIDNAEIEIDENLTISQRMKLLREKFDNGEITYEEYQAKRKELM